MNKNEKKINTDLKKFFQNHIKKIILFLFQIRVNLINKLFYNQNYILY